MKKKKVSKGLKLEKETIVKLNDEAKSKIKGGCHVTDSGSFTPMCKLTRITKDMTSPNN